MTMQPPNPHEAIQAYTGMRKRAEQDYQQARTQEERARAQFWIDNAERNLLYWRAQAQRGVK